ncbi:AMP-dependent synthetase/ligase [Penicillium expansum]|nr:AMP-dependent synthetase/ligase [Penicillium expansum]
MGPQLQRLAESKLKCKISQAWGLTETTGAVTWLPWDREDTTGSISQLLPNTRLKIVDGSERPVQDGHSGEILVRGPNVMLGYWENKEVTAQAFTADGWFRTGDIGTRKDGKFYIVDRKKELIKFKGLQVAPADIEAVLIEHDQILDAGVVGIPDPQLAGNEIPQAFNRPKTRKEFDKRRRRQKVYVIPRNLSGKILRRKLVQFEEHERPLKL